MFFVDVLLNLIFPPTCCACDEPLDVLSTAALCSGCSAKFIIEKDRKCPECGSVHAECSCTPKRLSKYCDDSIHAVEYSDSDGVARSLILRAKDRNLKYLYELVSGELLSLLKLRIDDIESYTLVYVPRSKRKKAQTGVDQSAKTSGMLAARLGIKVENVFEHKGNTAQKKLSAKERLKNAAHTYSLKRGKELSISGGRFILYDDVVTTGATLAACARLLKKAGAKRIVILTFGKTYPGYASGEEHVGKTRDMQRFFLRKKEKNSPDPRR